MMLHMSAVLRWSLTTCAANVPTGQRYHICVSGCNRDSSMLVQRYGRCEPRGSSAPDHTIATVVKAPDGGGLVATSAETDEARRGVRQISKAHSCLLLRKALIEELLRACNGSELEGTVLHMLLMHATSLACTTV